MAEVKMNEQLERAVLAGGCFWGMQQLIRRMPGVKSTRVGYSGGEVENATYRNHGNHAESIEIIFNRQNVVRLSDPELSDQSSIGAPLGI